jgi:hypothetical protein
VHGHRRIDDDGKTGDRHHRNRRQFLHRVEQRVLAQNHFGEVDRRTAEKDRVTIGRRVRDELRRQRSAGTRLIVDEDRTQTRLDLVGPGPADDVEHPAGGKRQDQPDRPLRVKRRTGRTRAAGQRGSAGRNA